MMTLMIFDSNQSRPADDGILAWGRCPLDGFRAAASRAKRKANRNVLRNDITVTDNALRRPWTANKRYRRDPNNPRPVWEETVCTEGNSHVRKYDVLEGETRNFKGPRAYDASGLPLHFDNQSV